MANPNEKNDELAASLDDFPNPFLSEAGELHDNPDAESPDSLQLVDPEPSATPDDGASDPEPVVTEVVDDGGIKEEKKPDSPLDLSAALGALGKDDKKQRNKGLRSQLGDRNETITKMEEQLKERDGQLEELRKQQEEQATETASAQQALANQHRVGEYAAASDPEVKSIDQRLLARLRKAPITLGAESGNKLSRNFEQLVGGYGRAIEGEGQEEFLALIDKSFEDDAPQVKAELAAMHELMQDRSRVIAENRSKHFQTVIGQHEGKAKEARDLVQIVGTLADDQLTDAADLNTIITWATKGDAGYKSEVDQVKRACAALGAGIRPFDIRDDRWKQHLDPMDLTRLTDAGEAVRQQEVHQYEKAQRDIPLKLAQAWAGSLLVPKLVAKITEMSARLGEDQEASIDPMITGTTADAPNPKANSDGSQLTDEMLDDPEKMNNPHLAALL